jgi:hypothetical protein
VPERRGRERRSPRRRWKPCTVRELRVSPHSRAEASADLAGPSDGAFNRAAFACGSASSIFAEGGGDDGDASCGRGALPGCLARSAPAHRPGSVAGPEWRWRRRYWRHHRCRLRTPPPLSAYHPQSQASICRVVRMLSSCRLLLASTPWPVRVNLAYVADQNGAVFGGRFPIQPPEDAGTPEGESRALKNADCERCRAPSIGLSAPGSCRLSRRRGVFASGLGAFCGSAGSGSLRAAGRLTGCFRPEAGSSWRLCQHFFFCDHCGVDCRLTGVRRSLRGRAGQRSAFGKWSDAAGHRARFTPCTARRARVRRRRDAAARSTGSGGIRFSPCYGCPVALLGPAPGGRPPR